MSEEILGRYKSKNRGRWPEDQGKKAAADELPRRVSYRTTEFGRPRTVYDRVGILEEARLKFEAENLKAETQGTLR